MHNTGRSIALLAAIGAARALPLMAGTPPPPGMHLAWSDEFETAGPPDPAKWGYELGFIRNHEPQKYTKKPANVRVQDGCLVLEARADGDGFTSACEMTSAKASWTYGRIEVRAKLPVASGAWPAIWMLGNSANATHDHQNWPLCGEIDIMELWPAKDAQDVRSTLHFAHASKPASIGGGVKVEDASEFHVYAVDWDAHVMTFSVDGKNFETVKIDAPGKIDGQAMHRPQYLLLNMALVPKTSLIDRSKLPMRMLVDYVRVYQK